MLVKSSHFRNVSLPSQKSLSSVFIDEQQPPMSTCTRPGAGVLHALGHGRVDLAVAEQSAPQPEMEMPSHGSFHSSTALTGPLGQPNSANRAATVLRKSPSHLGSQAKSPG